MVQLRAYVDLFGNRVTRLEVPPGRVTFSNRFTIADSGDPDATPPDSALTPISALPDAALLYLTSSRYCDSDKLSDFAWAHFGKIAGGTARVKAICDFVHGKIRFSYPDARSRAAPAIRSKRAWASAATSPISPLRCAAA